MLEIAEQRDAALAEVERLTEIRQSLSVDASKLFDMALERDALAAQVAALTKDAENYQTHFEHMAENCGRYQFLRPRDLETISTGGLFAGKIPANVI